MDGLECYVRGWFNPAWLNTIGLVQTNGPYQQCCKLAREYLLLRQFEYLVGHAITKESGLLDHLRLKNSRTPIFLSSLYFVANEDVSSLAKVLLYQEPDNYTPSDPVEAISYAFASLIVPTRYSRWEKRKDKEAYWVARDQFRDYFISLGKIQLTQLQNRISGELKSKQQEISSIIKALQIL